MFAAELREGGRERMRERERLGERERERERERDVFNCVYERELMTHSSTPLTERRDSLNGRRPTLHVHKPLIKHPVREQ